MSLDVALSNARSGLLLAQRQLAQSADNVANAGTAGHTRKTVEGRAVGVRDLGMGARAEVATRDVDAAVAARLDAARGERAGAEAREAILSGVERAHGDPESGGSVGDLLAALRTAFSGLRESPAEGPRQRAAVDAAASLATRFNETADAVGRARQEAQEGLEADVRALNAALREVAGLNREARLLKAEGRSTAAVEDRRDAAVARVAEVIGVRAVAGADGGVSLFARGGHVLPLDERGPDAFSVAPATLGPSAIGPAVLMGGTLDVTRALPGGRLAEHARLRDETLPRMGAELDVLAAATARRLEGQGLRLFDAPPSGAVPDPADPYSVPASGLMGFAGVVRVNPAVAADPALARDGTHAVPGFVPNPPGGPSAFAALIDRVTERALGTASAPGVPQPALPNAGLGPDGTLGSSLGGVAGRSVADQAARLVAAHTGERAAATSAREAASDTLGALEARSHDRSGVDTDAEMAAMVALQNAYAANARVLSAVQGMYDALLSAVR